MPLSARLSAAVLVGAAFAAGVSGAVGAPSLGPAVGRDVAVASAGGAMRPPHAGAPRTGEEIYRATCAACHGTDGAGAARSTVGFAVPLPDFTDCKFAATEADADWTAIVRDGGPVRGVSRIMPAFRDLLAPDEIRRVIAYVRSFCRERGWPRGEFNVPRAQVTEKAFPEDELVLTTAVETRGPGSVSNHLVYEKRFGARDQLEVDAPFAFVGREGKSWAGGLGDLSLADKHVLVSRLATGTIVSGLAGVILPTGSQENGFGTGTTAFEVNLLAAQLLPARSHLQLQGNVELPTDLSRAQRSASWAGALGTTVPFGPITRIWTPMVEVTGTRELVAGAPVEWDVVPQFQLSLSALQHVRANVGVDVPVTQTGTRHPQILAYLLWDTFDGPLFQSWKGWCPGCQH